MGCSGIDYDSFEYRALPNEHLHVETAVAVQLLMKKGIASKRVTDADDLVREGNLAKKVEI